MQALSYQSLTRTRRPLTYGFSFVVVAVLAVEWWLPLHRSLFLLFALMGAFFLWTLAELSTAWRHYKCLEQGLTLPPCVWNGPGLLLIAGLAILLRFSGGLQSPFYPLLYLSIAFLCSVGTSGQSILWFLFALLFEVLAVLSAGASRFALGAAGLHILYMTLFAGSHQWFLNGFLWSLRSEERAPSLSSLAEEETLFSSSSEQGFSPVQGLASLAPEPVTAFSMEAMQPDQQMLLALLKEGLDAHSCAFLWLSREGDEYEVAAMESDDKHIDPGPFHVHVGAPAGLFKSLSKLRISNRKSPILLPYYQRKKNIRSMVAVPVRQGGQIRGALIADRLKQEPFSAQEEVLLEAAAVILGSAIDSERTLWSSRSTLDFPNMGFPVPFWKQLTDFHSPALFGRQVLSSALQLEDYDLGFVSLCNGESTQEHTVLVASERWRDLEGITFEVGDSLLSLAFKHGCPLPGRGQLRSSSKQSGPYIATEDPPELEDVDSLLLLPLKLQSKVIGSVVLASKDPFRFADSAQSSDWSLFSSYVSALMYNILIRQELQRSRQRDTLTGLDNQRSFLDKLELKVEKTSNFGRKLSLLRVNLDDFGKLHQQHGLQVCDQIVAAFAQRLSGLVHDVDLIARTGGGEFLLLLDNTSSHQALKFADRVRAEMSKVTLHTSSEEEVVHSLSLSIGIATYPDHALSSARLMEYSQHALNAARHMGGDKVSLYGSSAEGESLPQMSLEERLLSSPRRGCGWGSLPPPSASHDEDPFSSPWLSSSGASGYEPSLQTPHPKEDPLVLLDDVLLPASLFAAEEE